MKKMTIVHQKKVLAVLPAVSVIMDILCLLLMAPHIPVAKRLIYTIAPQI
jgi:hypothetical protein